MRKDLPPEPVTPVGGDHDTANSGRGAPGPEPQIPPVPPEANPVYDATLTKEEILLLATLGVRNPTTGEVAPIKVMVGVLARLVQKIHEQTMEAAHEDKDSIELSRNAKEEYAYKIKVYFDAGRNTPVGLATIDGINQQMLAKYARAPRVLAEK